MASLEERGGDYIVTESTTSAGTVGRAEADPSKEEWAANLRRGVFQPSTTVAKSKVAKRDSTRVVLTQCPAHVMYFPSSELVDDGISFEPRDDQGRPAAGTAPSHRLSGPYHLRYHRLFLFYCGSIRCGQKELILSRVLETLRSQCGHRPVTCWPEYQIDG